MVESSRADARLNKLNGSMTNTNLKEVQREAVVMIQIVRRASAAMIEALFSQQEAQIQSDGDKPFGRKLMMYLNFDITINSQNITFLYLSSFKSE